MRTIFCILISCFRVLVFGQGLEHAYLFQNKLVIKIEFGEEDTSKFSTYIKVAELNHSTIPILTPYTVLPNTQFPSIWILDSNRVLTITPHGRNDYKRFTLEQTNLLTKDSLAAEKYEAMMREKFKEKDSETWEFRFFSYLVQYYRTIELFKITPLNDWWNVQFYHTFFEDITFLERYADTFKRNKITDVDFCYQSSSNQYRFFQRTENNLFVWCYTGGDKPETLPSDWQLERHYSRDSVFRVPNSAELDFLVNRKGLGQTHLPDTTHFLPCTITDTAFFRGHNKAIQQGNQHWLINTSHGAIYYLADYGVVKVAQIENFRDYPAAILQQRLFVEDRDRGELVFFSKLIRTDREAPLPKYRSLLTPREVTQRFGALATLPKTKNRK